MANNNSMSEDEFLEQDRAQNPGCFYSKALSTSFRSINGETKSEVIKRIIRSCPGRDPEEIYSTKEELQGHEAQKIVPEPFMGVLNVPTILDEVIPGLQDGLRGLFDGLPGAFGGGEDDPSFVFRGFGDGFKGFADFFSGPPPETKQPGPGESYPAPHRVDRETRQGQPNEGHTEAPRGWKVPFFARSRRHEESPSEFEDLDRYRGPVDKI